MAACDSKGKDTCLGVVGPTFPIDDGGNLIDPPTGPCVPRASGQGFLSPSSFDLNCRSFQLDKLENDSGFIEGVVEEALNIGGAKLNVYNLLGVHEQGQLVDCTGKGNPIAGGSLPNYPSSNAFDKFVTEWRSIQRGSAAIVASSYIGYDFGNIKTSDDSRAMYGIETNIFKHITALAIKQSDDPNRRIRRARVERSQDGINWYGVSMVLLPNDNCFNTVLIKDSVPSRYWRIRPLDFTGGDNDIWAVQALQLYHDYTATNVDNIQDKIFLENRDRDYNTDPITIKGYYDLIDVTTELTRYGIELPSQSLYITVSFNACVSAFGRPLIIGDILEIPSEAQFSAKMEKIDKWMEVTDVGWSTEGYTPGWRPTLLRIVAQPAIVSQETQDIFGDLAPNQDDSGLLDRDDGNDKIFQDFFDVSQTHEAYAKDAVPEKGAEGSSAIRQWEPEEIAAAEELGVDGQLTRTGLNATGLYVEDGMPPNNEPFTEGTEFPAGPTHGDYHRLTYEGMARDVLTHLYRYSGFKVQWIPLEADRREQYDPTKPTLQEFLTSPTKRHHHEILIDRNNIDDECEE